MSDKVKCAICGHESHRIQPLHMKLHGITTKQYRERFSNASVCSDFYLERASLLGKNHRANNPNPDNTKLGIENKKISLQYAQNEHYFDIFGKFLGSLSSVLSLMVFSSDDVAKERIKLGFKSDEYAGVGNWKTQESRDKMLAILRNNNTSGKTKAGLHKMLSDSSKSISFRRRKSDKGKEKWKDNDYRRNVINGVIESIKDGRLKIPYKRSVKGWFYSTKMKKSFYCRSNYELSVLRALDNMEEVLFFDMENLKVEYSYHNNLHIVIPDFLVTFRDGRRLIIETKNKFLLRCDDQTKVKILAIRKYAKRNGYDFMILTEDELGLGDGVKDAILLKGVI